MMNQLIKNKYTLIGVTLMAGVLLGWLIKPSGNSVEESATHEHEIFESGISSIYTCSMHPQIRQKEPGDCPICGMDLIPLESDTEEVDPMSIRMTATAIQLADVQTVIIGKEKAIKRLRLSGKIQVDERLLFTQASHIPGRIEQLMVNFTGEYIAKGQPIALVYSPELVTSQEELLQAYKIKDEQPSLLNAAIAKLKNWKVTDEQIKQILATEKVIKNFPIKANVSGYVSQKFANLGDHLEMGQAIYEVSNLSRVWVLLDVYEADIPWVKIGDEVSYSLQSIPGKTFSGKIDYLDPIIDPVTRVAHARISVDNPDLKFKPEMFVTGVVNSTILEGKEAIVIPKTAIMWTGTRSIVYVKKSIAQGVSFQLREVSLGTALGTQYLITSGLHPGEEIVVNGAFSIDAAAQLAGKPSMMSPEGGVNMSGHDHEDMRKVKQQESSKLSIYNQSSPTDLSSVLDHYFHLKNALATDDLTKAKATAEEMLKSLSNVEMTSLEESAPIEWMKYHMALLGLLEKIEAQNSLVTVRETFLSISDRMIKLVENFQALTHPLYVQYCPMADANKGAIWLSRNKEVINPYFGESMLTCGEVLKTIR
ncbi:efflux RND transporter periplasmic adaptor subunit [Cyclobacterium marinum]|uniref:Efflux transporter, RND family, MFP subunit n=1 Tax=Cyclobacterium marinum (strain ATCC 25205 / DSM 745 / LMG 13164 / NCIMB 1802) TaxID=880070 RepID=G0J012_CYCMS|nr:efflux RND transporter periplasmic adaptor subunit [Cyclobacterium marinum]AEL26514.1 efflux transporter, RND family, MFP subunit [Cyclobacterium marinum DSM 745]